LGHTAQAGEPLSVFLPKMKMTNALFRGAAAFVRATAAFVRATAAFARGTTVAFALLGAAALPLTATMAEAADITVLSGGAVEPGLHAAVAQFEKSSGHHVKITFNTAPQIQKRIEAGEKFDVLIAPPAAVDAFVRSGAAESGGAAIGRVGVGVAVRNDGKAPDISSTDALKRSLAEADSVVFNRASTGLYLENMLKKIGVWSAIEAKTVRYPDGASVMEHLIKGRGNEFGFGAMTEIVLYKDKGLRLVGPLPAEVQNYTSYLAALTASGKQSSAARDLVAYFATADARKAFVANGVE
jgi:molybdate transport system substrate-binding protein